MEELQEATKEFLIESLENLDQLDTDFVELEKSSHPREALGRIFRTLHTIKGSCSFLGFAGLEAVAHAGESLLGKLRDGELGLNAAITGGLLQMVDGIRRMLASIEGCGNDGGADAELVQLLHDLAANPATPGTLIVTPESAVGIKGTSAEFSLADDVAAIHSPVLEPVRLSGTLIAGDGAGQADVDGMVTGDSSGVYDASVRIGVELLDKLMTIAGEIVLARNQILQYSQRHGDPAFQNTCRQLNLITTELQEHVMKTRLQPIGNVWSRFPRLVRDAALACGKKVRLETAGAETELDKTLLEAIRDPLTHLVRNAIDHGIETPVRRVSAGKPDEGCVRLRAYHEGGQVNVEISDDGGGIDPERIKHRAIEQRLVGAEQANRMSTQTLLGLIFMPGFSTSPTITTVSGRGVGMDVVKTNIEKIGGSVDVHSVLGQGTTVRLRIPLTLAIIKVLVVTSAGDRYAIPQVSIVELVRVEADKIPQSIQRVHGVLVYRYRNRLLPLVYLNQVLLVDNSATEVVDAVNIVVLQAAERQFGLVVDGINDTQEIVVKPLWKHLKSLACFAGATVMGDGCVALILDVFGIAQRSGVVSDVATQPAATEATMAGDQSRESERVLLVQGRQRGLMAIALRDVARIEEVPRERVEEVADRHLVQYRGQILSLFDLDATLASAPSSHANVPLWNGRESLQVVVTVRADEPIGFVVDRILDVVDRDADTIGASSRKGVAGTAVIQGHVTEIVDVETLVGMAQGSWAR